MKLQTRDHPQRADKVQYRYLANNGKWVWGPQSARKASYRFCPFCGAEETFDQDDCGVVRSHCQCPHGSGWPVWWPSKSYETHNDSGAGWRRALKAALAR